MLSRRTVILLFPIVAVALAWISYRTAARGTFQVEANQSIKVPAFVAEKWFTSFTIHPGGAVIKKMLDERRSDGATVEKVLAEIAEPGEPEDKPIRRLLLPDGRQIAIDDQDGIRTTFHLPQQSLARFKKGLVAAAASQDCAQLSQIAMGSAVVAGYETRIWRLESVANDKSILRMTFYRAPKLGCAELERKLEHGSAEGVFTTKWIEIAQNVIEGEPPVNDMDPADGYREVLPSEFEVQASGRATLLDHALREGMCPTGKEPNCDAVMRYKDHRTELDNKYLAGRK